MCNGDIYRIFRFLARTGYYKKTAIRKRIILQLAKFSSDIKQNFDINSSGLLWYE
jgi:hypothetical protein